MKTLATLFSILPFVLAGCSSSSGPAQKTAQDYVNDGWSAYAAKNYSSAASSFQQAIGMNAGLVDAYNGAGWANGKTGNLATASARFTSGLGLDSTNVTMRAGMAFVANGQRDYPLSVLRAGQVLAADSSWVFGRDLSVTAADLHLLLAEDFFAQGDFASSLAEVQKIESGFVVNVSTDIGRMALADEIERLRPLV